jgi:hypothetical protein
MATLQEDFKKMETLPDFLCLDDSDSTTLAEAVDNCKQRGADATSRNISNEERESAKSRGAAELKAAKAAANDRMAKAEEELAGMSMEQRLEWLAHRQWTAEESAAQAAVDAVEAAEKAAAKAAKQAGYPEAKKKSPRQKELERFEAEWAAAMNDPEFAAKLGNMQAKAAAESSSHQAPAATMRQSDDLQPLQEMTNDQDPTTNCESCDGAM